MKSPAKIAALAAVPIEAVNLWLLLHSPLDSGFPDGTSLWVRVVFTQAGFLHVLGFYLYDLLNVKSSGSEAVFALTFLICGYIETFLLVMGMVYGFRWIRGMSHKRSGASE
jgi:hypothetical protein